MCFLVRCQLCYICNNVDVFVCPLCFQGRGDFQPQLDSAMQDVSDKYILLEETEKMALRKALIEDRQRFCCFVAMLRPVVVSTARGRERNESSESHLTPLERWNFMLSFF